MLIGTTVQNFVQQILKTDAKAGVVVAGDFNEFAFLEPIKLFAEVSGLHNMDDVAGIPQNERYTYTWEMNSQQLDYMFASEGIKYGAQYEHVHANTWALKGKQVSDHDPSVGRFNICTK